MSERIVKYVCGNGHVSYLRLTERRPEPDRWQGSVCGYCYRQGIESTMRMEAK